MYVNYYTSLCGNNIYMSEIAKIIGNNIKEARKVKGLTQKDVASKFMMTQQQYSRFENGVFELNYQQIIDICNLLNILPNDLFGFNI